MGRRVHRIAARLTGSWVFWVAALGAAFAMPVVRSVRRDLPPPPPVLGQVPDFTFTDENGEPFSLADLRGKVWVADFIFTSCGTVCNTLTSQMAEVQYHTRNMLGYAELVSFSVDPARDTPAVLREFATRYNARAGTWHFLTGPVELIEQTVVDGFKIAMQREATESPDFFQIVHGTRFVLVDHLGRIRGYYESSDEGIQELLNAMGYIAGFEMPKSAFS